MIGVILGTLYVVALMTVYYLLWRREERRVRREINQSLEDLKTQHAGD